jgi:hypothetical protein
MMYVADAAENIWVWHRRTAGGRGRGDIQKERGK